MNRATLAMAVDFSVLRQNNFWKKKFRRAVEVRDTNGDGYISRADFELMIDRCGKLIASNPGHVERFAQYWRKICDSFGLVDESVKFSYSEFEDKWISAMKVLVGKGTIANMGASLFHILDIDGDGFISFEEWTVYYKISGIDTAHARASFDAMDSNHDQRVSEEEYVKYNMEYFFSNENKLNSAILYGPLE